MFSMTLGDNLELRLPHENDAGALFELTDRNREYLRRWLPWLDLTKNVESSRGFIKHSLKRFADNNGFDAMVVYERKVIGVCGFHQIDWNHKRTEIGYWLDELYQGRGIMTRAVEALLHYGFEKLDLNRIAIHCASGNASSRAIPERLGFTHEGTTRQWECLYGVYHDSECYSMLAAEWCEKYGQEARKTLSSSSQRKRKTTGRIPTAKVAKSGKPTGKVQTGKVATGKIPKSRAGK